MKRFSYYLRYVLVSMICVSMVVLFAAQSEAGKFKKEYKMTLNVGPQFYWGMGGLENILTKHILLIIVLPH